MFYHVIRWLSLLAFRGLLWFRAEGTEHIPRAGAFIIAANHSSYLDPLLVAASTERGIHFVARDKLLKFPVLGWILKHAKTIPVRRHGGDLAAMKEALRVLKAGEGLGIFPEGTRTKDRMLKRAKPGVGMLVYKARVPVIPAYIDGAFDALPRQVRTFKRHPVSVRFGPPLDLAKEYGESSDKEVYQHISDQIMLRIGELKEKHTT